MANGDDDKNSDDPNRDDQNKPGNYQVVARRFRPTTFDELVGQAPIRQSLTDALGTGRIPHAFLFSGSRGVGKTTMARILARCLNCEVAVSADPCGKCQACQSVLAGRNPDVVEIDAASHNLVDDIRDLRDRVGFASMGSRYKVYILDEVHMLTRSAFNAFLKTLEEPPPNVVFILATTELHKVPDTIRSRCQVLLFQRVGEVAIQERLRRIAADEGLTLPDQVLLEIARSAAGGMRDSETALERILPVAQELGGAFTIDDYRRLVHRTGLAEVVEVVGSLLEGSARQALHFVDDLVGTGVDERELLGEILGVLRAVLMLKVDGPDSGLVNFGGELRTDLQQLAEATDIARLDAMIHAGLLGRERIRVVDDRRLVLEISMLRMAEAGRLPQLAELLAQVQAGGLAAPDPGSAEAAGRPPGRPPGRARGVAAPSAASGATAVQPGSNTGREAGRETGGLQARLRKHCAAKRGLLLRTLELCAIDDPDAAGVVRIELRTDRKLHRDRLAADEVQRELRQMIQDLTGAAVQLAISFAPLAGAAEEPAAPVKVSPHVEPGPGVRKVIERFDGKIVNIERDSD